MDLPLQRLQHCHLSGNWSRCSSHTSRRAAQQVQTAAAPAAAAKAAPITLSQRALLQTARRSRIAQQQGADADAAQQPVQQQKLPADLHSNLFRVHNLADTSPQEFEQLMDEHQRRQWLRMRQQQQQQHSLQHNQQHPGAHRQQQQQQHSTTQVQPPQQQQKQPAHLQQQQQQQPAGGSTSSEPPDQLQQRQLLQQHLALRQLIVQQQQRKRQLQLQVRREPAVLTALIKRSTSWQRLQQLFNGFTPLFNPIHVSAAITHLAQLQGDHPLTPEELASAPEGFQQLVQDLTAASIACIPDYGPRQITNSLWAISRLGSANLLTRKQRNSFLTTFCDRLEYAAPQHLAIMAAAVANMGWDTSKQWRLAVMLAAGTRLPYFRPPELAILLHGVARLGVKPPPQWLSSFLSACYSNMYSLSLQELSMLAVSLVRLQVQPEDSWLTVYLHAVQLQLSAPAAAGATDLSLRHNHAAGDNMGQQRSSALGDDCSHMLAGEQSEGMLAGEQLGAVQHAGGPAAAAAAADDDDDDDLDDDAGGGQEEFSFADAVEDERGQGLVNVLWALAVWKVVPPAQWQACCFAAVEQLCSKLTMQGVSTLLWSLGKLQVQLPQALLLQLLQHSQPLLAAANATDVAMMGWALGTMGVTAATLSDGTGPAAPQGSNTNSSSSSRSNLALALQAPFQGIDVHHPLQDSIAATAPAAAGDDTELASGEVRSSSSTNSGVPRSSQPGRSWGRRWLSDYVYHSFRVLPSSTAADVASLLVGAVRMRLTPGRQWLSSVLVEVTHRLPHMTAVQLTSTLLCLARLRCKPSQSFLQAYCSHSSVLLAATAAARGAAQYTPQSLSNTLGALASLGYRPAESWCTSFFAASSALLPRFLGRDFAYTIWALAQLGLRPPQQWMDSYLVQLRAHVPTMTSQQLSAVIWSLARLNHRPGIDWMNRFLDRVVALTPQQCLGGSNGNASSSRADGGDVVQQVEGSSSNQQLAPPSPLQLSGYFSAIILQGLTAWAASCLDLGFDGSSDGNNVVQRGGGSDAGTMVVVPPPPAAAAEASEAEAAKDHHPNTSVTTDGCIMFRF